MRSGRQEDEVRVKPFNESTFRKEATKAKFCFETFHIDGRDGEIISSVV